MKSNKQLNVDLEMSIDLIEYMFPLLWVRVVDVDLPIKKRIVRSYYSSSAPIMSI